MKQSKDELKKKLSAVEYAVTQENATERPFTGKYDNHYDKGIYVDIVSGEPLLLRQISMMPVVDGHLLLGHYQKL